MTFPSPFVILVVYTSVNRKGSSLFGVYKRDSLFEKPLVRILLNLKKVRHLQYLIDLRETHSHVFAKLLGFDPHKKITPF